MEHLDLVSQNNSRNFTGPISVATIFPSITAHAIQKDQSKKEKIDNGTRRRILPTCSRPLITTIQQKWPLTLEIWGLPTPTYNK